MVSAKNIYFSASLLKCQLNNPIIKLNVLRWCDTHVPTWESSPISWLMAPCAISTISDKQISFREAQHTSNHISVPLYTTQLIQSSSTWSRHTPVTYGCRALGTRLLAIFSCSGLQRPDSRPNAKPMRFSTSTSSWISNMLSKLKRYSNLWRQKRSVRREEQSRASWTHGTRSLVVGDAAVDDGSLAGADNDEGQVDDRVCWWRSLVLLLCLPIALHQVFKSNLLQITRNLTYKNHHQSSSIIMSMTSL